LLTFGSTEIANCPSDDDDDSGIDYEEEDDDDDYLHHDNHQCYMSKKGSNALSVLSK